MNVRSGRRQSMPSNSIESWAAVITTDVEVEAFTAVYFGEKNGARWTMPGLNELVLQAGSPAARLSTGARRSEASCGRAYPD